MKLTGRERVFYWVWMTVFYLGAIALGVWFAYSLLSPPVAVF